jgi:two-component system, sensor histidine kinase and response regulator
VAQQKAYQAGRLEDLQLDLQNAPLAIAEDKLRKLVEELIDNAFKFSEVGSPVKVSSQLDGKTFELSIIDQGRGMSAKQIDDVGAYMQFERKLYEQQGSGLGLTLAKRITELHGGKLTIKSTFGKQTTIRVTFQR